MSYDPRPSSCPACEAALPGEPTILGRDRFHGLPGEHAIFVCERCGAGVTAPLVDEEALQAFYPGDYAPHQAAGSSPLGRALASVLRQRTRRMLRVSPLRALRELQPARLLDVGCGRGDLGAELISRGWWVTGIDPSQAACERAAERGLEVHRGSLGRARLGSVEFDAVVFQQSLEHVIDPVSELRRAAALLRPGGLLLVSVPNFGCWERRRFGTHWFALELPRHRTHFTERALRTALERAGLSVQATTTSTLLTGLLASVQYRLLGRWRAGSGVGFQVMAVVSLALLPLIVALDRAAGGGELLHAVARA